MKRQNLGSKHNLNILVLICQMLGTMVGVGFVTGAEIYQFFIRFNINSIFGFCLFFILIFYLTNKILCETFNKQNSVKLHKFNIFYAKNTTLDKFKIKNFLTNINLILVASAMFAGLKNLLKHLFNHNYLSVCCLCVIFVVYVLWKGIKSLSKVNILVVVFLVFILFNLLYDYEIFDVKNNFEYINFSFKNITLSLLFSCAYVFMNIVEIQPVIRESKFNLSKKQSLKCALMFSVLLVSVLIIIGLFLSCHTEYLASSMPLLDYFKTKNIGVYLVFILGLILGLLSTLIGCLLGTKKWVKSIFDDEFYSTIFTVLIVMIFGLIEFSVFVKYIYPIIGVINFIIFVFM